MQANGHILLAGRRLGVVKVSSFSHRDGHAAFIASEIGAGTENVAIDLPSFDGDGTNLDFESIPVD